MSKEWRPDDWSNPYSKSDIENFGLGDTEVYNWEHPVYEAGADAMLKAVKKAICKVCLREPAAECNYKEKKNCWIMNAMGGVENV